MKEEKTLPDTMLKILQKDYLPYLNENLSRYIGNFITNNKQSYIGQAMSDSSKKMQFPFAFNDIFEEKKMQNMHSILSKLPDSASSYIGPRLEKLTGKLIHAINTKLSPALNCYENHKDCNLYLLEYVLNNQPSFQKMESIAALPIKHDYTHSSFAHIIRYLTQFNNVTSQHIEAASKIAITHDYGNIKFTYALNAFARNNPSPFQMNLVNNILIKHPYSADHLGKIVEYLVKYSPTKLQAYSAIDIAIQRDKSFDPIYFGNTLKYLHYLDSLYFLILLKNTFLNNICHAIFEEKSNAYKTCLITGYLVSFSAIIPCLASAHTLPLANYCVYPIYFYFLKKKFTKSNEYIQSHIQTYLGEKIASNIATPALTCISSVFLSYYPKLTCLTSVTYSIKTIILDDGEKKETFHEEHTDTKSDDNWYMLCFASLYATFSMLAAAKVTSYLLKTSAIYEKLALANILYNFFSLSSSLLDSIDQIIYKFVGKSFAACRSEYCTEKNDLFINLKNYSHDMIGKIDFSEFTKIYLQTDNKTLCEPYYEAIAEKFDKSEVSCQVVHDTL